jgi:hypothetical protein
VLHLIVTIIDVEGVRHAKLPLSEHDAQVLILKHQEEVLVVEDSAEAVPEGREELPQRGALHQNL